MGLELAIRGRFGIRRIGKGAFLALLLATASVTVLGGSPALAQAGAQTSFDIAPGPLGRARGLRPPVRNAGFL